MAMTFAVFVHDFHAASNPAFSAAAIVRDLSNLLCAVGVPIREDQRRPSAAFDPQRRVRLLQIGRIQCPKVLLNLRALRSFKQITG